MFMFKRKEEEKMNLISDCYMICIQYILHEIYKTTKCWWCYSDPNQTHIEWTECKSMSTLEGNFLFLSRAMELVCCQHLHMNLGMHRPIGFVLSTCLLKRTLAWCNPLLWKLGMHDGAINHQVSAVNLLPWILGLFGEVAWKCWHGFPPLFLAAIAVSKEWLFHSAD